MYRLTNKTYIHYINTQENYQQYTITLGSDRVSYDCGTLIFLGINPVICEMIYFPLTEEEKDQNFYSFLSKLLYILDSKLLIL